MKGLILVNGFTDNSSVKHKAERMTEEFLKFGVQCDTIKNNSFLAYVDNGKIEGNLDYDFCLYFDKDKYIARMLSKLKMPVFNTFEATEICDDKMATHIALANNGINMPKTLAGALCYNINDISELEIADYCKKISLQLEFPLVAKLCFGGFGQQVYKIENQTELVDWVKTHKHSPTLFQEFVKCNNFDFRVMVVGGKAIASMKRVAKEGDFRSNLELGGFAENVAPEKTALELAEKCAKILNLDFCGVDILQKENGEYLVCEVNSNAMLAGIEKTTGVNIANIYCQHILDKLKND